MEMTDNAPDQEAPTIKQCAFALGLHEFSLFSRIQAGDIIAARLRSGELAIPMCELERLLHVPANALAVPIAQTEANVSDANLGIQKHYGGPTRDNGERAEYAVPDYAGQFTEREIKSYRAAFGSVAGEFESLTGLKQQLDGYPASTLVTEIDTPQTGRWLVRSKLLHFRQSKILLCQRADYDFAVIERFRDDSPYAKANGNAEILLQGNRIRQLREDFKAGAQHTLEFMSSNLVARAQKVVWEQFPDDRPGHIVAAISERCQQAVSNEISQTQNVTQSTSRGIRI